MQVHFIATRNTYCEVLKYEYTSAKMLLLLALSLVRHLIHSKDATTAERICVEISFLFQGAAELSDETFT